MQQAAVLDAIMRRSPLAASHTHLAARLWGAEDGPENETNHVRVLVANLRKRVAPLGVRIESAPKVGYRLALDELATPARSAAA
jgi:DNA-binding response OmpR family regulator